MTKIITYSAKQTEFARLSDGKTVLAEQELDMLLKDGWQLLSSSTHSSSGSFGGFTTTTAYLTVVLHKGD